MVCAYKEEGDHEGPRHAPQGVRHMLRLRRHATFKVMKDGNGKIIQWKCSFGQSFFVHLPLRGFGSNNYRKYLEDLEENEGQHLTNKHTRKHILKDTHISTPTNTHTNTQTNTRTHKQKTNVVVERLFLMHK